MSKLVDRYIDQLATKLIQRGKELVKEAIDTRDYTHRTYNLHDSYGAGVYYKGRLIREYYNTPSKAKEPNLLHNGVFIYGEDDVKEYLRLGYKPNSSGLALVVVATMPYGETLEKGIGLKRKYKVISQISSSAELVANEFKGKVNTIGL